MSLEPADRSLSGAWGRGVLNDKPSTHMEMSLDFLSIHQLAGRRRPRRLLAGERIGKGEGEGREPGQDENSLYSYSMSKIMGRRVFPLSNLAPAWSPFPGKAQVALLGDVETPGSRGARGPARGAGTPRHLGGNHLAGPLAPGLRPVLPRERCFQGGCSGSEWG